MKQKKCLILYCDTGGGFKAPAMAVKKELEIRGYEVTLLDFAKDLGSKFVDDSLKKGWKLWLKYPQFFDYYMSFMSDRGTIIKILGNSMMKTRKKLLELIRKERYDLIFSVHFAATQVIGDLKKKQSVNAPVFAYNADVLVGHRCWLNDGIDVYFVPSQQAYNDMLKRGIKKEKLIMVEFPLDRKFMSIRGKKEIRNEMRLQDRFTVLLTQGGEGIGKIEEYVSSLLSMREKVNVIVICGRNEKLYNNLKEMEKTNGNLHAYGFVSNMQDFYKCSDLTVGKAGFNFVFESIYMQLPTIINNAIANERVAARFIAKHGMGWWVKDVSEFSSLVENLLKNKSMLEQAKKNLKKFAFSPNGAAEIAEKMISYTESHREKKTLLFDMAGTICRLDMGEKNWARVNKEGIKNVLRKIKIENYTSKEIADLADRFVQEKAELRKDAKATLMEHPIKDQLESFFNTIEVMPSRKGAFTDLLYRNEKRKEKLFDDLERIFIAPELRIVKPIAGINAILQQLAKSHKLVVIANNVSGILARKTLEKCNIQKFFSGVFVSADIGYRKPHQNFTDFVLEKTKVHPEDCIVIGDRLNQDILMAKQNSMTSVYVKISKHEDNKGVNNIIPNYEIVKIRDLLNVIEN